MYYDFDYDTVNEDKVFSIERFLKAFKEIEDQSIERSDCE